jgi:LPS export ABC transporter protein LptC
VRRAARSLAVARRRSWSKPLTYLLVIAIISGSYYIGLGGQGDNAADLLGGAQGDPGYAARDAEVIETGYDGRERYRLQARVVRQQTDSGVIELEDLRMNYHPGAQAAVPGEKPRAEAADEVWHLRSDQRQVRADGDDVQLTGNVQVTGPAPGSGEPLSLSTGTMRINTPTEFIQTDAPVKLRWSGYELDARGMQADLKAGKLRLESDVHGEFFSR